MKSNGRPTGRAVLASAPADYHLTSGRPPDTTTLTPAPLQRRKRASLSTPRECPVQRLGHILRLRNDLPHPHMPLVHEPLFDRTRKQLDERVEEGPCVDQHNGIQVEPQSLQRDR